MGREIIGVKQKGDNGQNRGNQTPNSRYCVVFVKDGRRDSTCRNTHSSSHFVNDSVHDHKKTAVSELTHLYGGFP